MAKIELYNKWGKSFSRAFVELRHYYMSWFLDWHICMEECRSGCVGGSYFRKLFDTFSGAKYSRKVGLMLTNSPLVLSGQRCDRSSGQTRKALRELVVEPHEEEVASEAGEGGEEGGGGLHQVHLRRGGGGRGQRTQLLPVALCHPLQ